MPRPPSAGSALWWSSASPGSCATWA